MDYQAIAALMAVVETQSFQDAADKLCVTQSAVSQRIKGLESFYGEPLLIRTLPYRPTRLGSILLDHFRRVKLLEEALNETLDSAQALQKISIAISRDSLETWFVSVIDQIKTLPSITLEILADDQETTLSYLKNGLVSACASTHNKPLPGCKIDLIGYFDYILVSSPEFKKTYFSGKNIKQALMNAPAIIFDNKDQLHAQYLKLFFDIENDHIPYHVIPSVAGFRQFALNGYAYALIPKIDIMNELKQGTLMNLFPEKVWKMPVYWHSWGIETKCYNLFNELVVRIGKKVLNNQ